MVTRIEDLVRARKRLAAGVGVTTLEQRVLPFVPIDVQIPARVGTAAPPSYRSAIAEPACLGSPLTEKPIGAGQPIDMYTLREWHTDRAALVSIDGLFSFARKPLKRWSAKLANLTLVEFFFSSPGTAASIYSPTAGAVQICEAAWSTREWHDRISATAGSLKLEFTLRRMKSISLQQDAYAFQWLFSSDSDPSTSGTPPACINRRSTENGLSNRLTYSKARSNSFRCSAADRSSPSSGRRRRADSSARWRFLLRTVLHRSICATLPAWRVPTFPMHCISVSRGMAG